MASERLVVPEEYLLEVVTVIRVGLKISERDDRISLVVKKNLSKWCDEMEDYMKEDRS